MQKVVGSNPISRSQKLTREREIGVRLILVSIFPAVVCVWLLA
jgi:hypothetical protein